MAIRWFDGFPFKSKEDDEREKREFEKRAFHLGPGHREAVTQVIQALFPNTKDLTDYLYAFVSSKDGYMLDDQDEGALVRAHKNLARLRWMSTQHIEWILALVVLDSRCTDLAQYPTKDDVLQYAQNH